MAEATNTNDRPIWGGLNNDIRGTQHQRENMLPDVYRSKLWNLLTQKLCAFTFETAKGKGLAFDRRARVSDLQHDKSTSQITCPMGNKQSRCQLHYWGGWLSRMNHKKSETDFLWCSNMIYCGKFILYLMNYSSPHSQYAHYTQRTYTLDCYKPSPPQEHGKP